MSILDRYIKVETQKVDPFDARNSATKEVHVFNALKFAIEAGIAFFVLLMLLAYWPFSSVPTGSRGVVTQFGKIERIENEGLARVMPWEKLSLFSIRSESVNVDNAEGSTNDQQPVDTSLTVRYAISTDKVAEVFEKYSHDGDLSSYATTAVQEVFKAVTARYSAPDLISKRPNVSADINTALNAKLAIYGAHVINIDMRNFAFSKSYMDAINEKVTQEQLRQGAENKLLTVQAEQKQKVAVAEAEASAVKATADGAAYATVKNAQAAADAIKAQGAALVTNPQVLELRRIEVSMKQAENWKGDVPTYMTAGAPIPFMNVGGK